MKRSWIGLGGILSAILLLVIPFVPVPEEVNLGLVAFLGRLHPLVVHFPIGLISVLLLFEILGRWARMSFLHKSVPLLLVLSVISTLVSVLVGFLLYRSGEYTGDLMRSHLWGGVILGLGMLVTAALFQYKGRTPGYLGALVLSNLVLVYTGHMGGSLTHGENFLAEALPGAVVTAPIEKKSPAEYEVFDDLVMPVLKRRCQSCHNPNKVKGGLLLTHFEDMLAGGKSGKAGIVPGDLEGSELYQRVVLPESDDDHMPPEGKPALKESEIALLKWWIESGAESGQVLGEAIEDSLVGSWLADLMPQLIEDHRETYQNQLTALERKEDVASLIRKWDLVLTVDEAEDSTLLAVSMRLPPPYVNDDFLADLTRYGESISKLSLPATEITDDGLFHLSQMSELRELYLQKTCVSGEGLVYLKELPRLEVLNLSYTKVDNVAALHLLEFPALKRVYLFHSDVSQNVVEALRAYESGVEFLMKEGPYF